jgi:hypothetical protein
MTQTKLADHIKKQLLADTALITRTQNHDFVALASQNRNISARFAQQLEKMAVEGLNIKKEFDTTATTAMLKKETTQNNQVILSEEFLMNLLRK